MPANSVTFSAIAITNATNNVMIGRRSPPIYLALAHHKHVHNDTIRSTVILSREKLVAINSLNASISKPLALRVNAALK